jgi:cytochrome b6-f complex iron-sulfur subunit
MCPSESRGVPEEREPPAAPRRRFIEYLLGGTLLASAISFLYPILRYLIPPAATDLGGDTVVAGHVGELKRNTGKVFRFGNRPALIVLTADGEYRAMSATCTHLNCTVQYRGDLRQVWCACHNGFYDLSGRNIAGPPPRPLEAYDVHVRGDEIVVNRRRGA